jgi:Cu(I)/Ag(I) efflux system protein CusF
MTGSEKGKGHMRKFILGAAMAAALLAPAILRPAAAQDLVSGEVKKVDLSAGKISIKHGPFKKFDMEDGMTMVYRVQDPAMLQAVKAGDKIRFDAEKVNGQFTVTRMEKAR